MVKHGSAKEALAAALRRKTRSGKKAAIRRNGWENQLLAGASTVSMVTAYVMMRLDHYLLLWLPLLLIGVPLIIYGMEKLRQRRLIQNIPTSTLRGVAMGLAEVCGKPLEGTKILKAPFSGRECVFFQYTITEKRGKTSKKIAEGYVGDDVVISDGTGTALIDLARADFDIKPYTQTGKLTKEQKQFLKSIDVSQGVMTTRTYHEYAILPDQEFYVMGTAEEIPRKTPKSPTVRITRGDAESFFYVSDRSEKDVLRKRLWQAIGGIFGGSAATLLGVAWLLAMIPKLFLLG